MKIISPKSIQASAKIEDVMDCVALQRYSLQMAVSSCGLCLILTFCLGFQERGVELIAIGSCMHVNTFVRCAKIMLEKQRKNDTKYCWG